MVIVHCEDCRWRWGGREFDALGVEVGETVGEVRRGGEMICHKGLWRRTLK